MSDFADSEFDYRGAAIYPGPPSSTASDNSKVVEVVYKSKKTTRGLFKKKSKEVFGGSFEREIAAASGEWVNEFIPNNGKRKSSAKLYVPSTAELLKRNIKRSWTISNPSGTAGPQLTARNDPMPMVEPRVAPMLDDRGARPTIVAQIPPPIGRQARQQQGTLPMPQKQRSAPVRSQSMGMADTGRFYMKGMNGIGGPPPRFRPPPPPDERRPMVHRRADYNETSSEGEEGPWEPPLVPDYRSWDRRKTQQQYAVPHPQKYKTLEPRSRSGGDAHSLERLNNNRRVLPELPREQFPSHSLPRPGSKRAQSHSVVRPEQSKPQEARRSQSHGEGLAAAEGRRKLPSVPGRIKERDLREPTPDYDTSPPPSEASRLTGRRNSDSGILNTQPASQGVSVRRHASSVEKIGRRLVTATQSSPENNLDSDDSIRKGRVVLHHTTESPASAASPNLQGGSKRKQKLVKVNSIARINNDLKQREEGARSANSITFSDLESTRIDFEDPNQTQTVIESDNNSDIVIDEKKIVPESSKFKIVFISSESKSGSELNSSLECAESPENGQNSSEDQLKNVKGDYIEEGDWLNYQKKTGKAGKMNNSSSPAGAGGGGGGGVKQKVRKFPQNLAARDSPRNSGGEDFSYVNNFLGDLKNRPPQSPSIRTIMTTATKDSNSIPASPQVPKIHNILIRREMELGQRPRSAMSMMSETSVDFEVQNILGSKQSSRGAAPGSANESQEIMIDFDSTIDSTGGNTSFELCTPTPLAKMASGVGVKQAHGNFHGKGYLAASSHRADSTRSSADRSLDEMSLYDQMCTQKIRRAAKKDPRVEEYRNLVLAEIKSLTGPGLMSRSLSESDLSELGGATGLGHEAPSDDGTENSTPTTLAQVHQKEDSNSTASSGYTTSSSGGGSRVQQGRTKQAVAKAKQLQAAGSGPAKPTPPPILPPKTRKLQPGVVGSSTAAASEQELSNAAVAANDSLGGSPAQPAALLRTPTSQPTKRQLRPSSPSSSSSNKSSSLLETFVDDGVSIVRIGTGTGLGRSASSVSGSSGLRKERIAKPLRRSKSQLPGSKFVTNITHGGSVTLVSLNEATNGRVPGQFHPIEPDFGGVDRGPGLHQGRTSIPAFQGSNTLPRAGQRNKLKPGLGTVDDSEIVITKKLTGGGSSVRIRIGGSARSPTEQLDEEGEGSGNPSEPAALASASGLKSAGRPLASSTPARPGGQPATSRERKYRLEEIEVEGFHPSDNEAEVDAEGLNSDFDLNSLIEGDVDDDDFGDEFVTALEEPKVDKKDGPVRVHFEPLKDPEGSVDEVLSEEELGSLAVNVGSLNNNQRGGSSDTEGDFLDKSFDSKKGVHLERANNRLEEDNEYKSNMADDENSVCGSDMDRVRDKKSVKVERGRSSAPGHDSDSDSGGQKKALKSNNTALPKLPDTELTTETSDFDSVSTTSASYVVSHSDMESLSLDDHQLDLLMNKSDLSDLDQIDAKTITGSGSSDEECPRTEAGGSGTGGSVESVLNLTEGGKLRPEVGQERCDPGRTDQAGCEGQDPSCGGGDVVEAQVVGAPPPAQDTPQSGPPVAGGRSEGAECGRSAALGGKQQYVRAGTQPPPPLPSSPSPALLSVKRQLVGSPTTADPVDTVRSCPRAELGKSKAGGVGLSDFDRQGTPDVPRRKGSVSELIAKFSASGSRSNTPERSITPDSRSLRSATPDKSVKSADDSSDGKIVGSREKTEANSTGARPKQPRQLAASQANEGLQETLGSAVSHGEIPTANESERAELRGLKEFTQKYLKEQAAKNASKKTEPQEEEAARRDPLGCEGGAEGVDSDIEDIDMPPTIRRNSGGAYTSYVFISNEPSNDEVASVVSSSGSYTDPENRVTVNVKETTVSPNTCVVAIQDGRTSNISIVSTESSELNSPRQSPTSLDEPPELPTKVKVGIGKDHNDLQQIVYATRESLRDFSHRSRGGEQDIPRDFIGEDEDDVEHDRGGLANYFTSTLESSSFISRRGRPPVIRAAEKVRRQQGSGFEYEDESRGMMIDYSDHQPYRESSSTPVLDVDSDMVEEYEGRDKFKITEVPIDDYSPAHSDVVYDEYDPQVQYDIHYGSGESGDEYIEREEYPRCQQVYDSEEYSYSEGEQISSGDEFDREEELRGYNRAIDFTLHTIIEESCEDSEPENRSLRAGNRKRHSDPSELEKYFFYGVGGGNMDQSMQEESEYSDTNSESNSLYTEGQQKETSVDSADLASTRLEKYFLTGFAGEEKQLHSLDVISEGGNTDDSGSVGSESDGTGEVVPEPPRKKVTQRTRGFRSERLSDRGESGAENVEDESGTYMARPHDVSYSSESGEDNTAFVSGDGSFDTIKRKKNKARKASDDRRSDSERSVDSRRSSAVSEVPFFKPADISNDTAGGTETVTVNKKDDKSSPKASPSITPTPLNDAHQSDPAVKKQISPSGSDKEPESTKPRGSGSSRESPSTSPPPAGGPVRKHKSRDSGFVGSNDDLLRNEGSHIIHTSSDDMQSKHTGSSSDGEQESRKITRLEKVSEVSENTEDDCEKSFDAKVTVASPKESSSVAANKSPRKKSNESDISKEGSESGKLSRKDSFHQWSSDEETNIMMNRMRSFFKNMLVNASKGKPLEPTRKPTQIVYFEEQLTRLMKTVPGINDQQVKEIVEYLSSEDTWSDSYDSSDYTDYTSSDLEGAPFFTESEDPVIPDMDVDVLEKLQKKDATQAASLGEMVEQDEFQKETAIMYQKLMNSVAKMQQSQEEQKKENEAKRSPPIAAKILHHISSRLVTLMHEVSGSDNSSTASISDSRQNLYLSSKDFRYQCVTSSPRPKSGSRRHRQLEAASSIDSNKSEDKLNKSGEENENSYTFNSLDSPKVLMGPNLGASPKSNPFKFTKNTSKSVEVLDLGRRRASLDDKSLKQSMAKSTSTDYDVWHGVHRDVDQRRGSLPRGQLDLVPSSSSGSGMADHDDERYSWKGSFESALASDSRTRLSIEAKRRSIGSDSNCEIFSSVEQMSGSHQGSRASLIPSRSPSQSSKRSLKSSLPNSRSSLHISKSEKDIARNSEFSTTPTSELSTKLSTQDSDSDDNSGSISSSVRSSISSRYGRRSSVPETQVLARLSEDEDRPEKPARTTIPSNASGAVSVRQHSTNSLPRLGTSAIQKSKSTSSTMITSVAPSQPSNIATSTQGGVRSARYRPHGYKPPPSRKMSPASGGPGSRKSSAHSIGSYYDEGSEVSSKSGTPSPMVTRVPARVEAGSSALAREVREPSVCSRGSSGGGDGEMEEREVHGSQLIKASSMSSLGNRSESMASVYSQGEGRYGTVTVRGEVEFGFIYSFGSGSLDISIKQCRDLAPVDLKRNRSDPYVKVYLLPDRSKAGKRKTKVKKHTLNPVFEEILKFAMPLGEVERRTMWISVWHSDMFGRNDFLGEVMLPMSGQLFDDPSSQWFSLQDRTEPPEDESVTNSKGDIIVALKYVPGEASGARKSSRKKGTLMILVKEAKNLPVPKGTTLPDPYCKCYLLPAVPSRGKQKTGICRRTTSPRWEQTIVWEDLSMEEVMERSLELAIWDHDRIGKTQDFLGGARFNLGSGRHLGRSVAWMDGTGKEVSLWQQMLDRPNFWVEGCIGLRPSLDTRPVQ